jgi:iron complex transport system substrate-binding protein
MRDINDVTGEVVDAAYRLHTRFGPGLLESAYRGVLARDLERRGLQVEQEKPISFEYDGMTIENAFRIDLLIESRVVVELKSLEKLAPVHAKQVLTYLNLLNLPIGLLINFGAVRLKDGMHRIINDRASTALECIVPRRRLG